MKRRDGIKEEGEREREREREESITKKKLVIKLVSNIKEQTSSDFAEDDIFNTTLFSFPSLII